MTDPADTTHFKTCFLSGSAGPDTAAVARLLMGRGLDVMQPPAARPGGGLDQTLLDMISAADFLVGILGSDSPTLTLFEIGVAAGMSKPVVLLKGRDAVVPSGLRADLTLALPEAERVQDLGRDLDRFLAHSGAPRSQVGVHSAESSDLGWAKAELANLRTLGVSHRGFGFERLVQRLFVRSGSDAELATEGEPDIGVDLVVWQNDLAFAVGGPLLVECKIFRGGSGSVLKNAEATARRLQSLLATTDAGLALLVFDHDRPHTPSTTFRTPDVVAIFIEDLIAALENQSFAQEILKRRRRYTFVGDIT